MKSSYKKLGNYIQIVNKRDTGKTVDRLLGVSIRKVLIPSIANIVGTDMSTYKIIQKNQFAYGPVTSRNGDKISVALLDEYDEAIVSQAYTVFEVIDKNELLPEYLMMWFRRPEFDRYARFKSHGSAREIFGWDEMFDTELPIPSIEKQKEIVKEYHILVDRIALNNQLISKLEETAQAIYKQWFVDFEFPDVNGKAYKSNGGEMEFCGELDSEIPKGWSVNLINKYIKLSQGLAMNASNKHLVVEKGIPLLRITDLINRTEEIFISEKVEKNVIAVKEDIIVSRTGQVGLVFRNKTGVVYNNCFKVNPFSNLNKEVLYWFLKTKKMYSIMNELASGSSAQLDLTHKQFYTLKFLLPTYSLQLKFSEKSIWISKHLEICELQVQKLEELKDLLLAKMTRVEEVKETVN